MSKAKIKDEALAVAKKSFLQKLKDIFLPCCLKVVDDVADKVADKAEEVITNKLPGEVGKEIGSLVSTVIQDSASIVSNEAVHVIGELTTESGGAH